MTGGIEHKPAPKKLFLFHFISLFPLVKSQTQSLIKKKEEYPEQKWENHLWETKNWSIKTLEIRERERERGEKFDQPCAVTF